jgi:hypothetical protein
MLCLASSLPLCNISAMRHDLLAATPVPKIGRIQITQA